MMGLYILSSCRSACCHPFITDNERLTVTRSVAQAILGGGGDNH